MKRLQSVAGAGEANSDGLNVAGEDHADATAPDASHRQPVRDVSPQVLPDLPGKITEVIQSIQQSIQPFDLDRCIFVHQNIPQSNHAGENTGEIVIKVSGTMKQLNAFGVCRRCSQILPAYDMTTGVDDNLP